MKRPNDLARLDDDALEGAFWLLMFLGWPLQLLLWPLAWLGRAMRRRTGDGPFDDFDSMD